MQLHRNTWMCGNKESWMFSKLITKKSSRNNPINPLKQAKKAEKWSDKFDFFSLPFTTFYISLFHPGNNWATISHFLHICRVINMNIAKNAHAYSKHFDTGIKQKSPKPFGFEDFSGGVGGIRTLGRLLTVTRFPVVLVMTSSIPLHRRPLFQTAWL